MYLFVPFRIGTVVMVTTGFFAWMLWYDIIRICELAITLLQVMRMDAPVAPTYYAGMVRGRVKPIVSLLALVICEL
jgi:hypothetical protein